MGVFTPSVLTILGVIMYLRFGWVVANAGLLGALLIVCICGATAFFTALSASAVATNMAMGAGGEYYLISRSLGLTIGGAIGIPLFLCRTLSVTLYCYGLAEALASIWPMEWGELPLQWVAAILVVVTTGIAGKSANIALKLQIPLMAAVALSLIALAWGVFSGPLTTPNLTIPTERLSGQGGFWVVLSVFFPAVTGFTAGIGLSGDLKDPQKSIPRGTLLALTAGLLTYLLVMVLLGITGKVTTEELSNIENPVWPKIALFGMVLIAPGMWAAILSSAFGSALAGPRVLQALARDGLMPRVLAYTSKSGQPVIATWAAGAIALSAVMLGELNAVAKLVTIFFLTLYVSINLVAAAESLVGDPSYRPTLRVHWFFSLLGACVSLVVIFLISPLACAVALLLELGIWFYLRSRTLQASWGDVWAGIWGSLARFSIEKLSSQKKDARSWRPHILLFADRVEERAALLRLSAQFNQNRGLLTVCDMLCGRMEESLEHVAERKLAMTEFFERERLLAFGEVDVVEDYGAGLIDIVQANGLGQLRSNTIVFGWPQRREALESQLAVVRTLHVMEKAVLMIRPAPATGPSRFKRIDVWWRGKQNNGDLMLLLAHLLRLNPVWRDAEINLRSIVLSENSQRDMLNSLTQLTQSVRIKTNRDVIVKPEDKSVVEIMHQTSSDADLVFIGLMAPERGREAEYAENLSKMVEGLPTTVMVRNSGPFQGQLI